MAAERSLLETMAGSSQEIRFNFLHVHRPLSVSNIYEAGLGGKGPLAHFTGCSPSTNSMLPPFLNTSS